MLSHQFDDAASLRRALQTYTEPPDGAVARLAAVARAQRPVHGPWRMVGLSLAVVVAMTSIAWAVSGVGSNPGPDSLSVGSPLDERAVTPQASPQATEPENDPGGGAVPAVELEPRQLSKTADSEVWEFTGRVVDSDDLVLIKYAFDFGDGTAPQVVRPPCDAAGGPTPHEFRAQHQFSDVVIFTIRLTVIMASTCDAKPAEQRTLRAQADIATPF